MDIGLLFRKRHALNDEGLPWLRGDERNTAWCARRNRRAKRASRPS